MTYDLTAAVRRGNRPTYRAFNGNFGTGHGIATLVRQYFRYRRDYKHQQQVPDHMLEDVGLTRKVINRAMKDLHI